MRFLLFMAAVSYLFFLCSCSKADDLSSRITSNPEGFVLLTTEYTDQGVFVKKDSSIKVCSASGDYLQNLKSLYENKPNDTLRGFYNYKVMEYKFTAPFCR